MEVFRGLEPVLAPRRLEIESPILNAASLGLREQATGLGVTVGLISRTIETSKNDVKREDHRATAIRRRMILIASWVPFR